MIDNDDHRNQTERRRLFIRDHLQQDQAIGLSEQHSHYLIRVLRMQKDDVLAVFNGSDGVWQARIEIADRNHAIVRILECLRPAEKIADLWLMSAPLKKHRFETVVEKATELGVAQILPILTRHSDVRDIRADRLEAIAIEAAEQCEGMSVPTIVSLQSLEKCLGSWPKDRPLLLCCERGNAQPIESVAQEIGMAPAGIAIGPAGGFHDDEIEIMNALPFVRPVAMGKRILRADTAAISAISVFLSASGFWKTQR